jgi:methionine sulfoxide reductase heme-binding subunit
MSQHIFWITSRAAGTLSLLFASAAMAVGLAMGGRMIRGRTADLRVAHEALSLAALVALVVHAVSLLGDTYTHLGLADIAIPFASSYREPWMALGVAGGWLLLILGVSYYFRARIGVDRWRRLHRWTALAWAMGLIHAVGEGTDAGLTWFLAAIGIVAVPAVALLVTRHLPVRAS